MKCIGFLDKTIKWFYSYLTNRVFFVSLDNVFLEAWTINEIPQALSNSHTYLYPEDTHQHKDISEIGNVSNKEFANVSKWFVDNKWSVHFGGDKTKCIIFSKEEKLPTLNITYDNNRIKPFHIVEYLDCCVDANLCKEPMAMKSLKKISAKLHFLHRQNEFLNPKLRGLLRNSLIQL